MTAAAGARGRVVMAACGRHSLVAAAMLLALLQAAQLASALTQPSQLAAITYLRDSLYNKSSNWQNALSSWTCPTDPVMSSGSCDPCSIGWSGNWEHIHCRGVAGPYGEGSVGSGDGYITTTHITDMNLDGGPYPEFCLLNGLREWDLDGGQASGPFPRFITEPWPKPRAGGNGSQCIPNMQELDLSFNRLTGTIPPEIALKTSLQEFKVEHNFLTGTIPAVFTTMPHLWRIRLEENKLTGSLPPEFSKMADRLNEIWLDGNDLSGDLSALGPLKLTFVKVHNNPRLCGMVPASVRYAHGYNPANTRLGQPC